MGFLSQIANIFTGSEDAKAAKGAGRVQEQASKDAAAGVRVAGDTALDRFSGLNEVGQQGIDLAGFLGDPNAQADFAQNNPLYQLGLDNLNQQTNKSAASRGRLTAGDTLTQLQNNSTRAAAPLIDRQRNDILNLLNIQQGVSGQQANIDLGVETDIANLLTGGAAAKAAGIVGAQNARSGAIGNVLDVGMMIADDMGKKGTPGIPGTPAVGGQSPNNFAAFNPLGVNK
tara:strand:+ start:382 stop:1068 length:687 start_codon:yes stop_codon:yes gene_type:complete